MRRLLDSRFVTAGLIAAAAGVALFTVLRLTGLGSGIWPVASFTAFALYLVPLAAGAAIASLLLSRRRCAAVFAICAAALGVTAVARATPNDQPAASGPVVRVTSANLLMGQADPAALAEIVDQRKTDVLALQEYTHGTGAQLRAAGVFDRLPYMVRRSTGRRRDTVIASRWPLELSDAPALPDVYTVARARLPATGAAEARWLPLVSAHPTPPVKPGNQGNWQGWLAALPGPQGALSGGIVAGDFNATLDHPQFRDVLDRGWRDAGSELGEGLRPTWAGKARHAPARVLKLTIDHVLIPPGAAARDYAIDPLPGSDHRVVTATVVLPAAT